MTTNASGLRPVDVKALVLPDKVEEKTAGGIIKPEMSRDKEKYATVRATLIAKGPNAFVEWGDGNAPEIGDKVLTAQYAGMNVKGDDGVEYRMINDEDVVAVVGGDE